MLGGLSDEKSQNMGMGHGILPVYDNLYRLRTQVGGIIMLEILKKIDAKTSGIFAAGVLFGTAGIKILSSRDAKKVYTNCTAAVLRARECVMKTAATIQENAEDIYAEAQQINEERAAKDAEVYADEPEQTEEAGEEA